MPSIAAPIRRVQSDLDGRSQTLLLLCLGLTLLLRLPFLGTPLGIDEGGYAFVAANWGEGSGGIYGGQWVDRPPLLFVLYSGALWLAGDVGIRLLGCVAAVIVVLASASVAGKVAGPRAMRWAAVTATVLTSSTVTQANIVNAELLAIAFVAGALWLTMRAWVAEHPAQVWGWGVTAGIVAASAVLVKQSFVDAFAFAAGLLLTALVIGSQEPAVRARVSKVLLAGLAGAAAATAITAVWAEWRGPGVSGLTDALYGFRLEARSTIDAAPEAPRTRAVFLLALTGLTGMLSLFAFVFVGCVRIAAERHRHLVREQAVLVRATCGGMVLLGMLGIAGIIMGGNWWLHYLVQLTPFLAVGAGIVVALPRAGRSKVAAHSRTWTAVLIFTTLLAWVGTVAWSSFEGMQRTPMATGDWLRAAARPGDTAIVTWGHANVLHRSGLASPYPLVWSLPIRVQDPQLKRLLRVLRSPQAPTFILEWRPIGSWNLDPQGKVRHTVDLRYERVASVCGKSVYRLRSRSSDPVPPSSEAACGSGRGLSVRDTKLF